MRSIAELPLYFDDRHRALAETLDGLESFSDDPQTCVHQLGERGLLEHVAPDADPDVIGLCLIRERLAQLSPQADSIFAVQGLGTTPLRLAGYPGAAALLERARRGEAIFGFALTEPEAGSDVGSMQASAERAGDRWSVSGQKTLISNVGVATHYTVFACADPAAGSRGLAAFLVEAGADGLTETPMEVVCDHPIGALALEGVSGELVGAVGEGFRLAMRTLDVFRVTVAAAAVGMAERALELALAHARERTQFGGPLGDKQIIQGYLADMATELAASRALVYRAAHAVSGGARATAAVAQAKLFSTEAAQRIIDRAVQIHGGRGVVRGEAIEALYRAIRPLRIYEGASEIQKLIIYRELSK